MYQHILMYKKKKIKLSFEPTTLMIEKAISRIL